MKCLNLQEFSLIRMLKNVLNNFYVTSNIYDFSFSGDTILDLLRALAGINSRFGMNALIYIFCGIIIHS